MTAMRRLTAIGFLVPAVVHGVGAIGYSGMMLFTAPVSYPLMVVITFLFLVPLHLLFGRFHLSPWAQLPVGATAGLTGDLLVQALVFQHALLDGQGLISRAAVSNLSLGFGASLVCCVLYNWGPVNPTDRRANVQLSQ